MGESMAVALAETMTESGHYDIDSTTVRAHVSAAGGKEGFINETLGRARGGFTSKIKPPAPELFSCPHSPRGRLRYPNRLRRLRWRNGRRHSPLG